MKKVLVYVEGPSDQFAMTELLRPLIEQKQQMGVSIEFTHLGEKSADNSRKHWGAGKESLLKKVPIMAANAVPYNPNLIIIVMPDLYPKDRPFPHKTFEELEVGAIKKFEELLQNKPKSIKDNAKLRQQFKVFCFKHDLEALVRAAEEALKIKLGITNLQPGWKIPVEDQNNDRPPSKIVEELFRKHGKSYNKIVDGLNILGVSDYQTIAERCFQCFKPFVNFLTDLEAKDA